MKRVFVPTISGADCQRLLAKPKLHWKVGASAMTAAAAWYAAGDRLRREITTLFDATLDPALVNLRLLAAIPGMASRTSRRHYELVHGNVRRSVARTERDARADGDGNELKRLDLVVIWKRTAACFIEKAVGIRCF